MEVTCIIHYKVMERGQRAGQVELKLLVSVGRRLHRIKEGGQGKPHGAEART